MIILGVILTIQLALFVALVFRFSGVKSVWDALGLVAVALNSTLIGALMWRGIATLGGVQ